MSPRGGYNNSAAGAATTRPTPTPTPTSTPSPPEHVIATNKNVMVIHETVSDVSDDEPNEPNWGYTELAKQLWSLQSINHAYAAQIDKLERKIKIMSQVNNNKNNNYVYYNNIITASAAVSVTPPPPNTNTTTNTGLVGMAEVQLALDKACEKEAHKELRVEIETLRAQLAIVTKNRGKIASSTTTGSNNSSTSSGTLPTSSILADPEKHPEDDIMATNANTAAAAAAVTNEATKTTTTTTTSQQQQQRITDLERQVAELQDLNESLNLQISERDGTLRVHQFQASQQVESMREDHSKERKDQEYQYQLREEQLERHHAVAMQQLQQKLNVQSEATFVARNQVTTLESRVVELETMNESLNLKVSKLTDVLETERSNATTAMREWLAGREMDQIEWQNQKNKLEEEIKKLKQEYTAALESFANVETPSLPSSWSSTLEDENKYLTSQVAALRIQLAEYTGHKNNNNNNNKNEAQVKRPTCWI